ncbi:MAG: anthranilate synthase component I [Bacillota bacterium]
MRFKTRTFSGDVLTPITVYQQMKGTKKFILESSLGHGEKGRYSFIGQNPFKEVIGEEQVVTIIHHHTGETTKVTDTLPIEVVKQEIPRIDLGLPYLFYGGAIGYIGYDVIRGYEDIGEVLEDELDMPDVHLLFYQEVIIFDHKNQTVTLIAVDLTEDRDEALLVEALDQLETEIRQAHDVKKEPELQITFKPTLAKQAFMDKVTQAKQHIIDGDIFQIVLSQRLVAEYSDDPFELYRKLRISNPSPYMYYIQFGPYVVLGTSPESLIQVRGSEVVTNPIAGTRKRGVTKAQDDALARELLADEKERAEHKMLVDLSRNDLGRIAKVHSITLPKFMTIERYEHVMHIVSEVRATLDGSMDSLDCLTATLPAGTVSGAPKIKAMQLINQFETKKRGVYSGACGYINMNGDLDLALSIRTMVVKDNHAYVQAGAGIVYDSDPLSEYEETLNKAKSLVEVFKR